MKQQELNNIIAKLQTDDKFAISVVNLKTNKSIVINATDEDLILQYGGAKAFFEKLFKDGVTQIRVCPRKQNGSRAGSNGTRKNFGTYEMPAFEFDFEPKELMVEAKQVEPVTQPLPAVPELNGGLYADMTNIYKIQHYDILKDDYSRVKAERNQLRNNKIDLERKLFEQDTLGVRAIEKSKAQKELLEVGQGYAPIVIEILKGLKPTPIEPIGLSAGLSPIKQTFVNAEDSLLMELKVVADCLEKQGFEDELNSLVEKYKSM